MEASGGHMKVASVAQVGTAASLGMRPGDVIMELQGVHPSAAGQVAQIMRSARQGQTITATVRRDGRDMHLRGKASAAPLEHYDGATVGYGVIPFRGGRLRDILVRPVGTQSGPLVFLIQGYGCATIESRRPDDEVGELARAFAKRGIAFYRVEKPDVGDSEGGVSCRDADFATELDAYRTAYRHLADLGYAPDRVFILGHSLGGVEAPLLAAERPPRGVAVFGALLRNWADYMLDVDRLQDFAILGADPGETQARAEADRDAIRRFFFDREPLASIAARAPANVPSLTNLFGWDGGTQAFGRSENFMQDLARLNLAAAWRDTHSRVLSLYGASDVIALNGQDQRDLVDIVNFYRPQTAEYVEVPGTMHGMDVAGDRSELRRRSRAAGTLVYGAFNSVVADTLVAWIKRSMAAPPVR